MRIKQGNDAMYKTAMCLIFGFAFLGLTACNGNQTNPANSSYSYTGFDSSAPVNVNPEADGSSF
ncbi:hypothetical protein [Martelella mediterranea]|nr:hypothetical protein [Martelella mediterranea]